MNTFELINEININNPLIYKAGYEDGTYKYLDNITIADYPIFINNHLDDAQVINCKIQGNTGQNSTPTSTTPIAVKSIGQLVSDGEHAGKYQIHINQCKKNLLHLDEGKQQSWLGPEYEIQASELNINGNIGYYVAGEMAYRLTYPYGTANYPSFLNTQDGKIILSPGTYTLSCKMAGGNMEIPSGRLRFSYMLGRQSGPAKITIAFEYTNEDATSNIKSKTFTISETTTFNYIMSIVTPTNEEEISKFNNCTFQFQLEKNSSATEYEVYTEEQYTLYLNEPLNSIVDNNQIYTDFLDLKNQEIIKNTKTYTFTGNENILINNSTSFNTFCIPKLIHNYEYKASDYFVHTSPENGPWACQYYTPTSGYNNMTSTWGSSGHTGSAWIYKRTDLPSDPHAMAAAIGKYIMNAERENAGIQPDYSIRAVRTFTAPYNGTITISADDGSGNNAIVGSINNPGGFVRITHNGNIVFPQDGSNEIQVPAGDGTQPGRLYLYNIHIDVTTGDKIHFEVGNGESADQHHSTWSKQIYWNPIITYNAFNDFPHKIGTKTNVLSNYFYNNQNEEQTDTIQMYDPFIYINANYSDLNSFKDQINIWNNNQQPLQIFFPLKEPIIEKFECDSLILKQNINTIYLDTLIEPKYFEITYYESPQKIINELKNTIIELGGEI